MKTINDLKKALDLDTMVRIAAKESKERAATRRKREMDTCSERKYLTRTKKVLKQTGGVV